jgi:hypothetical protein
MMKLQNIVLNERGSAIVIVIMLIALLSFVGIATITFTTTELQTAGNDLRSKIAFYNADGAVEVASELLEQNTNCPNGFSISNIGDVVVEDLDFRQNTVPSAPSDADRDLYFPAGYGTGPHTNVNIGGSTGTTQGASIIMASGYEREGKSKAAGGTFKLYDIVSQHEGSLNTVSLIRAQWRHVVRDGGTCLY